MSGQEAGGTRDLPGTFSPLRVGIDGRAFRSPAGGIRRYVHNLVSAVGELGTDVEIVALGGDASGIPPGLPHQREPLHPPSNAGWMLIGLPLAAARARVHVLHAPAYTAPFPSRLPIVVTIHDVSYARRPEFYPSRVGPLRQWFYRRSALGASRILTDSDFSAAEIVAAYGVPRKRISVVPLGVSPGFSPADPDVPNELPASVVEPYLLHVGDLHERRNLGVVVEALAAARRHFGATAALSLVLAGVDRGVGDDLGRVAADSGIGDAVVRVGAVSEPRLKALYRGAVALVYPSLYEGFGLPPLEAMACGLPVLASRAASIPEVVGDAGLLLDPGDPTAWAQAIVRVVNDEHLRRQLRASGLARAQQFTWERTAALTVAAYRDVASRQGTS